MLPGVLLRLSSRMLPWLSSPRWRLSKAFISSLIDMFLLRGYGAAGIPRISSLALDPVLWCLWRPL